MSNLKLAFRTLLKTPFVTLVAVVSLALGIGANAAIFSLFDQILLRPLPVPAPERLVNLGAPGPKPGSQSCGNAGDCEQVFSYLMFRDLERVQTVFTGIAAHVSLGVNIGYRGHTLSGEAMLVSGTYFPVLGLQPALGRLLSPDDDRVIGESSVAVLSYAYWRTRFQEDPSVLGEVLIVNGQPMTIVGVAPQGFDGTTLGTMAHLFVPFTMRMSLQQGWKGFENRRSYWAYLFARLEPGVSMDEARAAMNVPYRAIINDVEASLQENMSEQTLQRFRTKELTVTDGMRGQSDVRGEAGAPLRLLLGVTALVLVIACANIANLLLVRGAGRASEMAVRLSIGANRRQLITQLLTESVLLAALGGIAGLLVARWTLNSIASLLPAEATESLQFVIDGRALLFAGGLTLMTGLLFGLFPALHSTRPDLVSSLKGEAGQPSGARAAARFRTSLATAQIALSMALLVSAGLFTRSLFNVSRVTLGVTVEHLVTFSIYPGRSGYTPERSRALFERLEDELAALPGVTGVTSAMVALLSGNNWGQDVSVEGFEWGPDVDDNSRFNGVGPGYFRTLGVPILAGREFTRADTLGAPKVAIVNEQFAKKFNLGREAVGKRMASNDNKTDLDIEIVGLVQNAKYSEVKREIPPIFFLPSRQRDDLGYNTFYIRTAQQDQQLLAAIPKVMSALDANVPVENLKTLAQQVQDNVFLDRFISVLSAAFAALATLLAAVGLYGVLAYTVTQRTREIGLRMALGADPGRVRSMVLRQVGVMTIVGGAIGLAAAVGLGRLAQSMLFELQGHDQVVLVGATVLLALVALGAGLIPAHRASQVDPMRALRYQ